jgi:hypothetical protein
MSANVNIPAEMDAEADPIAVSQQLQQVTEENRRLRERLQNMAILLSELAEAIEESGATRHQEARNRATHLRVEAERCFDP